MLKGLFSTVKKKIKNALGTSEDKSRDISPVKYNTPQGPKRSDKKPHRASETKSEDTRKPEGRPRRDTSSRDSSSRDSSSRNASARDTSSREASSTRDSGFRDRKSQQRYSRQQGELKPHSEQKPQNEQKSQSEQKPQGEPREQGGRRDQRFSRDQRNSRSQRDTRELKEQRPGKDSRETKEQRNLKEPVSPKEPRQQEDLKKEESAKKEFRGHRPHHQQQPRRTQKDETPVAEESSAKEGQTGSAESGDTQQQKQQQKRPGGYRGRNRRRDYPGREKQDAEKPDEVKSGEEKSVDAAMPEAELSAGITEAAAETAPVEKWDSSVFVVEPDTEKTRFHDLPISDEIMHAIYDLGYQYCTPIQAGILSATLSGKDATGQAQTGTGKTAAFLITVFSRLLQNPIDLSKRRHGTPRALILAPTRELVLQITEDANNLSKYTRLNILPVYGGMDYRKQKRQLNTQHVDVVVATPGRLLDFHTRHDIHLSRTEILVIDEADRMLDMGFIPDVRNIVRRTPHRENRQTLFFSATLNDVVKRLASQWTKESFDVEIEPEQVEVNTVNQIVYIVTNEEKLRVLFNLLDRENLERVIIFANRRDEVKTLFDTLQQKGISSSHLSGDIDQKQRIKTLDEFKSGKIRVLIATDVASRGIHIDGVSHVINFTLPEDAEDYVHRIGRTGRAGASGISISFASEDDSFQIPAIEQYLGHKLECVYPDDELLK